VSKVDDAMTSIVDAGTHEEATDYAATLSTGVLRGLADLMHVDWLGMGRKRLLATVVTEARI
jgi:hypothetical protein